MIYCRRFDERRKIMNITKKFLEEIDNVYRMHIPDKVIEKSKMSLLDYLGVTLAGAKTQEKKINTYLKYENPESGIFPIIGLNRKINLKDAVFLNGLNSHVLDFDDGTNVGIIHLGTPIFSALLPLAQKYEITGERMLKAAIIGYETAFSMAVSIQPGHKELGYHATGTCGVLGTAVAISYMLDYTEEQRADTFSTACVSATGMLKVIEDGSELKPFNVAKASLLALVSAQMARAGFHGHNNVLSGSKGYLKMMTGKEEVILKNPLLDGTYAIEKTYIKPYAACRYCHPSIEAIIKIREKYQLKLEQIKKIDVYTYYWAVNKHNHTNIMGIGSAKMSIPYGIAVGFLYGKAGLEEYDSIHIVNEDILSLTKKVTVYSDDKFTKLFPLRTPAVVKVIMTNGVELTERIDYPKGEPENPLSPREVREKFVELALYNGKNTGEIEEIIDIIMSPNIQMSKLFQLL